MKEGQTEKRAKSKGPATLGPQTASWINQYTAQ